jgi:F0F1-type ATP synthase membrane subunit b/b'
MTKAQVKQYVKDLKKAQEEAQKRLDAAKASGEMEKEQAEVNALEEQLNNL